MPRSAREISAKLHTWALTAQASATPGPARQLPSPSQLQQIRPRPSPSRAPAASHQSQSFTSFQQLLMGRRKGKDFKKPEVKDVKKMEPICYECKKPKHMKAECLKLKKTEIRKQDSSRKLKRYKKKAMAAAWDNNSDSDSESSSSEEEDEKANLAFMANFEDKVILLGLVGPLTYEHSWAD
ncbi:hypothetical protein Taro_049963 [Colocasia esculenta]|uniref:CCHC-type domain-containing protein n=1 Tax=Colocasia esculenta TaxID=4460 RepID=A0A843XC73_COLES|nr:hypothetical protein [Colocasia esculenta]